MSPPFFRNRIQGPRIQGKGLRKALRQGNEVSLALEPLMRLVREKAQVRARQVTPRLQPGRHLQAGSRNRQ